MLKSSSLIFLILLPTFAHSQAREIRLNVLSLNEDVTRFVVRYEDGNQGTAIQIREMDTNAVKKSYFVDSKAQERKRIKRLKRGKYKLKPHLDQIDPKGRYTILGAPDGHRGYQIMVMRGNRLGVLGKIPLKKDDTGKIFAKAMLKEVVWTPNSRRLMVVVNQRIDRRNGVEDVDDIHFFRFRAWKIKWLKPEPLANDEKSTE